MNRTVAAGVLDAWNRALDSCDSFVHNLLLLLLLLYINLIFQHAVVWGQSNLTSLSASLPLQVWSCSSCFSLFHLPCIQKWAKDSAFLVSSVTDEDFGQKQHPWPWWGQHTCMTVFLNQVAFTLVLSSVCHSCCGCGNPGKSPGNLWKAVLHDDEIYQFGCETFASVGVF